MTSKEEVTTPSEAAREKGCSTQTIYNAINRGRLTGFKVGPAWIVTRDEKYATFAPVETGARVRGDK